MGIIEKIKGIFKKPENKDKKLSSDVVGIEINRLVNGTPVVIADFLASLQRDNNNNTIMFNEDFNFKEEMPGIQDSLVSDILYKLEIRNMSSEAQKDKINKAITSQEKLIKSINNGYIIKEIKTTEGKKENQKIKINIRTEESKLRLLKCVKYTLDNKKGKGFFETISLSGVRTLKYLLVDGELIPYFHKTPTSEGEPVLLVPDIVQRKKFYRESRDEVINDFNESMDHRWKGLFALISKALVVILLLVNVFFLFHNSKVSQELSSAGCGDEIRSLQIRNEAISQQCTEDQRKYMSSNEELINYAKIKLKEEQEKISEIDKANLKI